ncbi:hypothetical protein T439DRAFT_329192 [Meredithblackwellia eburnea MCA 4105]
MLPIELQLISKLITRSSQTPFLAPCRRALSNTAIARETIASSSYPGLFYHSVPDSTTRYSVSFLPHPAPDLAFSPTTIGILNPASSTGLEGALGSLKEHQEAGVPPLLPSNFEENKEFKELLHDVLREAVWDDLALQTEATVRGEGFIHLTDYRNPADLNRVPAPDDIVASILVQDGKLVPGSYEPSMTHRTVTMDGMMRLGEELMVVLRSKLEVVRGVETEFVRDEN